jgi:hypothetical protein
VGWVLTDQRSPSVLIPRTQVDRTGALQAVRERAHRALALVDRGRRLARSVDDRVQEGEVVLGLHL